MARSTAVYTLDDLDGKPATETVRFGLDGIEYDIDLSDPNARTLRTLLQRYIDSGRRTGGRQRRPRRIGGSKGRGGRSAAQTTARGVASPAGTASGTSTAAERPAASPVPPVTFSAAAT
jgi:hypothetical protein